jgi:uncharacterized protein (DUF885 family)
MVTSTIEAHIHFRHTLEEVAELNQAIIPMADHIHAVSSSEQRKAMKSILGGQYFRARQATRMVTMLLNAAKHAKAHLGDYFPLMHAEILDNALALEEAALNYRADFAVLKNETLPTH